MLILPSKYLNCTCVWKQFQGGKIGSTPALGTTARYVIPTDIFHTLFLQSAQKNRIYLNVNSTIPSAEITVPNVTRDLLMLAPSFNLLPVAPVEFALSL